MDLELSADQELFAETTRRFLEQECPIGEVRRLHDEVPSGFDPAYWRRGAELGWTAMLGPEGLGGGGVGGPVGGAGTVGAGERGRGCGEPARQRGPTRGGASRSGVGGAGRD